MIKCGECVRHDNCWLYDEHKDDNGTCVWAESKSITESPNEAIKQQNDVIEIVRCRDCKWYKPNQLVPVHPLLGGGIVYENHCDVNLGFAPKENDFCSRGERREE